MTEYNYTSDPYYIHVNSNYDEQRGVRFSNKYNVNRQPNNLTIRSSMLTTKDATTTQETEILNPSSVVQQKRTLDDDATQKQKTSKSGRSRLFIGNIPTDLKDEQLKELLTKYGTIIESYVNPERGFAFVKMATRQQAEHVKQELDGSIISNKAIRIRFASQGTIVKVKNLSSNVSNELLKEAFEIYFGSVESALVIVDDRGRSTGEAIIEFERKPAAQKCLKECTESCFFLTDSLRPITVQPWDIRDEDDGLPEKSLIKDEIYYRQRQTKPRFAEQDSFEHMVGLKWKELELQEKQLLEDVKQRMQCAAENLKLEIDQILLARQAEQLQAELNRRQEDLRRIDERRLYDFHRFHPMFPDPRFVSNDVGAGEYSYGNEYFAQMSMPNSVETGFSADPTVDPTISTNNQVTRGYYYNPRKRARH